MPSTSSLARDLVELLRARRQTVTFAESCTGGLLAAALTEVPGASDVFEGSVVTYAPRLKTEWAGVPEPLIREKGVVSEEVAERMAEGALQRAAATWAAAVTGYAGPGGGDANAPAGTVVVAVAGPGGATSQRHHFQGGRDQVRAEAVTAALQLLWTWLQQGESKYD